jgi:hypothetical protein
VGKKIEIGPVLVLYLRLGFKHPLISTFKEYGCLFTCFVDRFLLIHYYFFLNKQTQASFVFLSVQAQGTKAEDSLCVELKKVKLEMILKVEVYRIFVLCSKEVMQQGLGKEKRNLKGVFFVLCSHERLNVEAWELKKNLGRKLKEKLQRLVVDSTSSPLLPMVMLS